MCLVQPFNLVHPGDESFKLVESLLDVIADVVIEPERGHNLCQ